MAVKVWSEESLDRCWESEGSRESLLDVGLWLDCGCAEHDQKPLWKKVGWKSFFGGNRQFTLPEEDRWLKGRKSGMTRGCKLFVWNKVGLDGPKLLLGGRFWSEAGMKEGMMSSDLTCTEASPDTHHHPRHSLALFLHVVYVSLVWLS